MTKFKNTIFSLLLVSIFFTSCNAQTKTQQTNETVIEQLSFTSKNTKLTKTQGTDHYQNVHCSLQDKNGNLWFGTTGEGIYRYDGKEFTQFTEKDGLSSNKVWSVLEDKSGNIWIGTTNGVCLYDGKSIKPIPISKDFTYSNSNNNYYTDWSTKNTVWSMLQDKNGTIWFGTGDGVYCYNGLSFTPFLNDVTVINKEGLHLKMIDCILEDKNGNIWFASGMLPGEEGLCRFDGKSITRYRPGGDGWIRHIEEDKNGVIWSGGRHRGAWHFDGTTFTKFTEKQQIGIPLLVDKKGNIWFGGEEHNNGYEGSGGVWRYDGQAFENFTIKDGMGNYGVWSIVEDKTGNIWFGTKNCGLYRYDGQTFKTFSE